MPKPFLKPEALLLASRRQIQRHHGRFDNQGAGTTHGIDKIAAVLGQLRPSGTHQQGRSQVFLQRSRAFFGAVAAHMQAVTTNIDAQRQSATIQTCRYRDVRHLGRHRGALTTTGAEPVDDTVFDALSPVLGVADSVVLPEKSHPETAGHRNVLLPVHVHHAVIQLVTAGGINLIQMKDDPVSQTRPQTGPVTAFQTTLRPDTSRCIAHRFQAESTEFVCQEVFNPFWAAYEKDGFGQVQLLVHSSSGKFPE